MAHDERKKDKLKTRTIGVRVDEEQRGLIKEAADREGLQISSFIIMILVRLRILPPESMDNLKRRPVEHYTALHELLGVVNKIGGNCKQLTVALPETPGLDRTHNRLILAAACITDALQGHKVPEGVNLYRLQADLTKQGHRFNKIVKSVNTGRPDLSDLPPTLLAVAGAADVITAALTGQPLPTNSVLAEADILEQALAEMRANMRKPKGSGK